MARGLLDPLADPCGVDEAPLAAAELDQLVDRVDGGAGDVVDDRPGPPGPACSAARTCRRWACRRSRSGAGRRPRREPRAAAPAAPRGWRRACRRSRGRAARRPGTAHRARGSTARGLGLDPQVVHLVGGQHDRLAGLAQHLTTASSASVMPTVASTTKSTASASVTAISAWAADPLGHPAGVGVPAPGVDHRERAAVPVGVVGDPVAGHARHVLDHGLAAADDPVDQRRLADVGAADDGQHRHRTGHSGRSSVAVRCRTPQSSF